MKLILTILLFPIIAFSQDMQGKILPSGSYSNCTIKNAVLKDDYKFDTSVTLINCKAREFSTAWFGASPLIKDNSVYIQKAINTCIANNITNLYCADSYTYSQSLKACNIVNGKYIGFGLNFYGDGDRWNQKQTLTYTGKDFAYGVQMAKGGSFRGITIIGQNTGSGVVVDYMQTGGGSTGFFIEDTRIGNFDINYNISPTGLAVNGDIIHLNNIKSGKCRVAVRSGQPQNKGNEINGFYTWDSCQIAFQIYEGNWIVRGGDIAGYCGQMLDLTLGGWNTFSIQGMFAESLKSLGTINAKNSVYAPPVNLQDMDIRFIPGTQVLFISNSPKVRISNSALWFYTGKCCEIMNFAGPFIWDNNDCGGCQINNNQIIYIIAVPNTPIL